jgi:monoamine oxidase
LFLLLVVPSAISASPCDTKGQHPNDPLDVLIIGAGWAGLAAANRLHERSTASITPFEQQEKDKFCVLEARHAIGGRSRTEVGALIPDFPTELGSAWVWPDSVITDIFREAGLNTGSPSYYDYDSMALYFGPWGGRIDNDKPAYQFLKESYENFEGYVDVHADHDVSVKTLMEQYFAENPDMGNLPRQTINAILCGTLHSEYGVYFAEGDSEYLDGRMSPSYSIDLVALPGGGFKHALDYFAAPFLDHIQLNTQVLEVDYSDSNANDLVKVISLDRTTNETSVHYARTVVCTVSLGVLQWGDLHFKPALPAKKAQTIQAMGMGLVNKCVMYWNSTEKDVSWWPDTQDMQLITEEEDDSMDWTYFINDQAHEGNEENHILTAWIGGIAADRWENRTDEETITHILKNLRRMFPSPLEVPEPTKFVVTRWKSDPFTRGTYHYHRVGIDTYEGQDILAEPVGSKLFFAGEATAEGMSAHTAYWTGDRAIDQILESGVLDTPITTFPQPNPICSRSAHVCRLDSDCCAGLQCIQRSMWRETKICTSRTPIVWRDEEEQQQQISLRGALP